jgi:hypothetical protein
MNNKGGVFDYITKEYVLAGCKMQLGLRDTTAEDMYLLDAINQGLNDLRNFGTQVYIVTQLEVNHDGVTPKAVLPEGFVRFVKRNPIVYVTADGRVTTGTSDGMVQLSVVEGDGTNLGTQTLPAMIGWSNYCSPTFINNPFFENSPYGGVNYLGGTVNLVDGVLYFSDDVIADFIKIAYLGTNIQEGEIKIPAYAELALRYFACEMWSATQFAVTGDQKFRVMMADFAPKAAKFKAKAKVIPLLPDTNEYSFINYTYKTLV